MVSHGYLPQMRIALVQGRDFTQRDDEKSPLALVVNQAFVERFCPGRSPVGRHVTSARCIWTGVELEAACYGRRRAGSAGACRCWDALHVRLLNPQTGQLPREHLRQNRGGCRNVHA